MGPVYVMYRNNRGEIVGYPSGTTVSILLPGESEPVEVDSDSPDLHLLPPALTKSQLGMLRSYERGPRIWDASALARQVEELAGMGLIRPHGDKAYELTGLGRIRLRSATQGE